MRTTITTLAAVLVAAAPAGAGPGLPGVLIQ